MIRARPDSATAERIASDASAAAAAPRVVLSRVDRQVHGNHFDDDDRSITPFLHTVSMAPTLGTPGLKSRLHKSRGVTGFHTIHPAATPGLTPPVAGGAMGLDRRKHALTDAFRLFLSDSRNLEQRAVRAGLQACEMLQGAVMEDDVWRHAALAGQLEPQRAQRLEQRTFILAECCRGRGRCASSSRLRAGGPQSARLAVQHGVSSAPEQRHAVGCELQRRVLLA